MGVSNLQEKLKALKEQKEAVRGTTFRVSPPQPHAHLFFAPAMNNGDHSPRS